MRPRYAVLWGVIFAGALLEGTTDCRKPVDPSDVEAGITIVDSTCRFLEGVTDDGELIAVCATVEEIAFVVSVLLPLLEAQPPSREDCKHVPLTDLCATKEQIGQAVRKLVSRRKAHLLLDGG